MTLLVGTGLLALITLTAGALLFRLLWTQARNSFRLKLALSALFVCTGISCTVAILYYVGFWGDNFRAVQDSECYRSASLPLPILERRVKEYGIKTVVNLRGSSRQPWYTDQRGLLTRLNVNQEDIVLDTKDLPRPESLSALIRVIHDGKKPLLLHCNHGVDRTGIAAVLYKSIIGKVPLRAAIESEQSIYSGHIATSNNDAGDRFFELYDAEPTQVSLESWILEKYPLRYKEARLEAKNKTDIAWYNSPFRLGPITITPFKCLGILGATMFACRWFVQAYYSRRAGRPVTPLNFWLMSIFGSLMMLVYFAFSAKQDIVGIISNFFPAAVAAYNVFLELRHRSRERREPIASVGTTTTPPLTR